MKAYAKVKLGRTPILEILFEVSPPYLVLDPTRPVSLVHRPFLPIQQVLMKPLSKVIVLVLFAAMTASFGYVPLYQ